MGLNKEQAIINRCVLLKELHDYGAPSLKEVLTKYKVNGAFGTILLNKNIVTNINKEGRIVWNVSAEPNKKLAENLFNEEKKYLDLHRPSRYKIDIVEKAVNTQVNQKEVTKESDKDFEINIKVTNKGIILKSEDFIKLLNNGNRY